MFSLISMLAAYQETEVTYEGEGFFFIDWIIPVLITALVFGVFGFIMIRAMVLSIRHKRILKTGTKRLARYLGYGPGKIITRTVNNRVVSQTQYFTIDYEFKNDAGFIVKAKSPDSYQLYEVKMFEQAHYFDVVVSGDGSAIPYTPTKAHIAKYSAMKDIKVCSYCGSKVEEKQPKCSSCGSSTFDSLI